MDLSTETSPQTSTVRCKICKEQIQAGAIKCVHCDSFQDWRGSLNLSASILGLLVALISVLAFTAPIFQKLLTPNNSHVILSFSKVQFESIFLIASNTGVRPGSFGGAELRIRFSNASQKQEEVVQLFQFVENGVHEASLVAPGGSKEIQLVAPDPYLYRASPTGSDYCVLRSWSIEFDGKRTEFNFPRNCEDFKSFLKVRLW